MQHKIKVMVGNTAVYLGVDEDKATEVYDFAKQQQQGVIMYVDDVAVRQYTTTKVEE